MSINLEISPSIFNDIYLKYQLKNSNRFQICFGGSSSGESVSLAQRCVLDVLKGRNYLVVRNVYLSDKNIIVQSVGQINNRDNIITVDYEYRNGFDVAFCLFDEIKKDIETIETVEFQEEVLHCL